MGSSLSSTETGSSSPRPQTRSSQSFSAGQLPALLTGLEQRKVSGILNLTLQKDPNLPYSRIIVLNQGKSVYAGTQIPTQEDIVNLVKEHLSGQWTDLLVEAHKSSPQALLERFVFLNLCTWEQIQKIFLKKVVTALEPVMSCGGRFELDLKPQPPILSGFGSDVVLQQITSRQSQWKIQAPDIAGWEVKPLLMPLALEILSDPQQLKVHPDQRILKGLQHWLKNGGSLLEISERYRLDPLQLAQVLQQGVNRSWIRLGGSEPDLPTLLTVDDSDLMRQLISRVLGKEYRVLTASNAMSALALLAQEPIKLLLLDVSMPGIDGLELCRSIRSMAPFHSLPIIMVTGRDGLFDKVKGRMAGATEYLTKPFVENQLKMLVARHVPVGNTGK